MFDIATVLVIGGVAMYAGKKDLVLATRMLGKGFGILVGTIQGTRLKFEEHSSNSELGKLRDSVRTGLRNISTISTDILHSGTMNQTSSRTTVSASSPQPSPTLKTGINLNSESVKRSDFPKIVATDADFSETERMARLILADAELLKKYGASSHDCNSGAGIIQDAISGSILNSFYATSMNQKSNT